MKQSKRNQRNAVATAERKSGGKPAQSKYELKRARQLAGTNAMSEELQDFLGRMTG